MRHRELGLKECATDLKGDVNSIIWDWSIQLTEVEFKVLYNLVHYIDTFLLECFDEKGKLSNKLWIQKKLIESVIYLGSSERPELHRIMDKVINLENLIYLEEIPANGNKDSDSK